MSSLNAFTSFTDWTANGGCAKLWMLGHNWTPSSCRFPTIKRQIIVVSIPHSCWSPVLLVYPILVVGSKPPSKIEILLFYPLVLLYVGLSVLLLLKKLVYAVFSSPIVKSGLVYPTWCVVIWLKNLVNILMFGLVNVDPYISHWLLQNL